MPAGLSVPSLLGGGEGRGQCDGGGSERLSEVGEGEQVRVDLNGSPSSQHLNSSSRRVNDDEVAMAPDT